MLNKVIHSANKYKNLSSIDLNVSPFFKSCLKKLGIHNLWDLLFHVPTSVILRYRFNTIKDAHQHLIRHGTIKIILSLTVVEHHAPLRPSSPYRVIMEDHQKSKMDIVFFRGNPGYIKRSLPVGKHVMVCGDGSLSHGVVTIAHPDQITDASHSATVPLWDILYPLTKGLTHRTLQRIIQGYLNHIPVYPEWVAPHVVQQQGWMAFHEALRKTHNPSNPNDLDPTSPHRERLAYDELLAHHLAMGIVRLQRHRCAGISIPSSSQLPKIIESLPYGLTPCQQRALTEILDDMGSNYAMLRLLHGDVGSGKTAVAMIAMMNAVLGGYQAAIIAPTALLARQHYETFLPFMASFNIPIALVLGGQSDGKKNAIRQQLADGSVPIAIGTHALFQNEVEFKNLGFVVIDEQHRFGVKQRLTLAHKGQGVNVLLMTATPIPRTLVLVHYGDVDVSVLNEKPPGRHPVETSILNMNQMASLLERIRYYLNEGHQIYWVCPLIEESEKSDLAAAVDRYDELCQFFQHHTIGLMHGAMKEPEKKTVMDGFQKGDIKILVSTTVIEVGVNVPQATLMIVEHAERFGLSQLHQLRGRVGRGGNRSFCILLYQGPLSPDARERLSILRETDDGFKIAEVDLRLRGGGDTLGTRQSGMQTMRLADPILHSDLSFLARQDADAFLAKDPYFQSERGQHLKILLDIFGHHAGTAMLRAG